MTALFQRDTLTMRCRSSHGSGSTTRVNATKLLQSPVETIGPSQSPRQRMILQPPPLSAQLLPRRTVVIGREIGVRDRQVLALDIAGVGDDRHRLPPVRHRAVLAPLHVDARAHAVRAGVAQRRFLRAQDAAVEVRPEALERVRRRPRTRPRRPRDRTDRCLQGKSMSSSQNR